MEENTAHKEAMREAKKLERDVKQETREVTRLEKIIAKLRRVELQEFTNYLNSPWRIFWANMLAGTARGLGFFLGAAFIIAIVGFIITGVLSHIPWVGQFFQAINIWIQQALQTTKKL